MINEVNNLEISYAMQVGGFWDYSIEPPAVTANARFTEVCISEIYGSVTLAFSCEYVGIGSSCICNTTRPALSCDDVSMAVTDRTTRRLSV